MEPMLEETTWVRAQFNAWAPSKEMVVAQNRLLAALRKQICDLNDELRKWKILAALAYGAVAICTAINVASILWGR